jgi:hypothetical protein
MPALGEIAFVILYHVECRRSPTPAKTFYAGDEIFLAKDRLSDFEEMNMQPKANRGNSHE